MNLTSWIQLRTFHYGQFFHLPSLLQMKKSQGVSVSLCLPALNEANTIGAIIRILQKNLMKRFPLIDEIIVIDSGSSDGTPEKAKRAGATVFLADEILPETGHVRGKGENLWKSIYAASGDILVWLDTDIENMHPRFVFGLLGPLLYHKEIGYVKAFYRRPLRVGKKLAPVGGGRVTEILVKPFFNLLYPQLSVFQQPLSGEYAARRELIERIPVFSGYGVETGLLIDVESRFGLGRMAQVDLEVRIHRNQDLAALKRMAFGILKVLFMRAEQQGKLILMENIKSNLMTLQLNMNKREYQMISEEVMEVERPPMILNEKYQQKREIQEDDLLLLEGKQAQRKYLPITLNPFLDKNLVVLNGKAKVKERVLKEITDVFKERGIIENAGRLYYEFLKREASLTTAIGEGIAVPHAIYEGVKTLRILIYRNPEGIQFDAIDAQPVNLVFAVISPSSRRAQYLGVLSALANVLKDSRIRELLLKATSREEMVAIIRKAEIVKRFQRELHLIEE